MVDLHHGDVRAERERRVALVEVELCGEPQRAVGVVDRVGMLLGSERQRCPVERRRRHARHANGAGRDVDDDVGLVGLQQAGREPTGLVHHGFRGPMHCRTTQLQRA